MNNQNDPDQLLKQALDLVRQAEGVTFTHSNDGKPPTATARDGNQPDTIFFDVVRMLEKLIGKYTHPHDTGLEGAELNRLIALQLKDTPAACGVFRAPNGWMTLDNQTLFLDTDHVCPPALNWAESSDTAVSLPLPPGLYFRLSYFPPIAGVPSTAYAEILHESNMAQSVAGAFGQLPALAIARTWYKFKIGKKD